MTDDFPPMRYFMGTARRCRCCHFSSRPTTECPDNIRVIPVPACVIFLTSGTTTDGHDCHKLLDAETGKVVFSRDVTWHNPEAPLIPPATAVGNPPIAPPEDIYVPMHVPSVSAPAPAPVPPAPAPTPSPMPVPAPAPTPATPTPPPPIPMTNPPA